MMNTKSINIPKISIIVPIYNVEKYLPQCMDSLLNQTMTDIEIILVDDGSPDNCPTMCDEYARQDTRVKVIHKKNAGLGLARNSGLKIAQGKYLAFIDSDDYVELDTYQKLCIFADEREADAVYFNHRRFDDQGNKWLHHGINKYFLYHTEEENRKFILDFISNDPEAKLDRKIMCSACCVLYKNDVVKRFGIEFKSEREYYSEDLLFNLDYLLHSVNIFTIPDIFYNYRMNPVSTTKMLTLKPDIINKCYYFYLYLLGWVKKNDFGMEGYLRATRNFIGFTRLTIQQYIKSPFSRREKLQWLKETVNKNYWKEIATSYPYRKLPWNQALQFYLLYKNYSRLLYYHALIYSFYSKINFKNNNNI